MFGNCIWLVLAKIKLFLHITKQSHLQSSFHRFSMRLWPGLWVIPRLWSSFAWNHFLVDVNVCFGLLSCCKVKFFFIFIFWHCQKVLYQNSFTIGAHLHWLETLSQLKNQPQSMMLPPPHFTGGMVFFGLWLYCFFTSISFRPCSYTALSCNMCDKIVSGKHQVQVWTRSNISRSHAVIRSLKPHLEVVWNAYGHIIFVVWTWTSIDAS